MGIWIIDAHPRRIQAAPSPQTSRIHSASNRNDQASAALRWWEAQQSKNHIKSYGPNRRKAKAFIFPLPSDSSSSNNRLSPMVTAVIVVDVDGWWVAWRAQDAAHFVIRCNYLEKLWF